MLLKTTHKDATLSWEPSEILARQTEYLVESGQCSERSPTSGGGKPADMSSSRQRTVLIFCDKFYLIPTAPSTAAGGGLRKHHDQDVSTAVAGMLFYAMSFAADSPAVNRESL